MQKIYLIVFIVVICISCKIQKIDDSIYGTYCWFDNVPSGELKGEQLFLKLKLNEDNTYEIFHYSVENNNIYGVITDIYFLDSCKGNIKIKTKEIRLKPAFTKDYYVKKLGKRNDDSAFIYCYYSTYNVKDIGTTFRILDANDSIKKDFFKSTDGIIKLLINDDDTYLQTIGNDGGLTSYNFRKILKLEKGQNYYLWLSKRRIELEEYVFNKINDSIYNLRQHYVERYGHLDFPMIRCDK